MNKYITLSFLLLISVFAIGQNNQYIKTKAYSKVVVGKQINIEIKQTDSAYIEVLTDNFDMNKLSYSIENKTLYIGVKGYKNNFIDVELGCPEYKQIKASGAADISSIGEISGANLYIELSGASSAKIDLDYHKLSVKLSGASDVKISGNVDSIYLNLSGASDFDGFNTQNKYASVQASGASDVKINTDSVLMADITGASSLKYKKEPTTKKINSKESVWVSYDDMGVYVSEDEDTVRVNLGNGRSEIIIVDGDEGVRVEKRRNRCKSRFKGNWAGLELGVNGYLNNTGGLDMPKGYEFLELKYEKSTNFNINFFQQSFNLAGNKLGLVTGMGIQWYNYRFSNDVVIRADSSVLYGYNDDNSGKSYIKSKLTASYLVIPLLLEFQTNPHHNSRSFHISGGVIGGVRLGSHSKQVYTENGSGKTKPKTYDSFYLQPFRLDGTMRIGWGPINLYANYSIIEMFRKDRGPELYPFTVGLILPFT